MSSVVRRWDHHLNVSFSPPPETAHHYMFQAAGVVSVCHCSTQVELTKCTDTGVGAFLTLGWAGFGDILSS